MDAALLALFIVHVAIFARLTWMRRETRHAVATVTFLLLVCVYGVRLWWPEWMLAQEPVSLWLRRAAWGGAGISLGLFLRRRFIAPKA